MSRRSSELMNCEFDIAIVGAGLSGARVLINLINRLRQNCVSFNPLRIVVFDSVAEYGKGVPYGSRSDRQALLIETLKDTRCPEFAEWIANNPTLVTTLQHSDHECDRRWYYRNALALAEGKFEDVYFPRHLFGTFSASVLEQRLNTAAAHGFANIARRTEEVISVLPLSSGTYRIATDKDSYCARHVVISVGSIPRFDSFYRPTPLFQRCYLADHQFCGCFDIDAAVERYVTASPQGAIHLAVVGAAASAIESIYRIVNDPRISSRVASVIVISRSGLLPGGIRDNEVDQSNISAYALNRSSASDYVELARYLHQQGRLKVIAAQVTEVLENHDRLRVVFAKPGSAGQSLLADLVLNCSGGGDLLTTPSRLLKKLAQHLPTRENDRGFQMQNEYEIATWPNAWVLGPLLNHSALNSHVESINAVFHASDKLSQRLHQKIMQFTATGT